MERCFSIFVLILLLCSTACSSVKSDAEEAVGLVIESLEYTRDGKLEKAERRYKEYKEIESKYKDTEDYDAFLEAYSKCYKEKVLTSIKD